MQRLFVALVPPPDAVRELERVVAAGRGVDDDLRWTAVEQWHVTLAFLPSVPEAVLPELTERLRRAAGRRRVESARIVGAGAFPRAARATVVWAGVSSEGPELARLASGCRAAARRAGLGVAEGRFRPHLTLARLPRPRDVSGVVARLSDYSGPTWPIGQIRLVASHLGQGPGGRPRYETLATLSLSP